MAVSFRLIWLPLIFLTACHPKGFEEKIPSITGENFYNELAQYNREFPGRWEKQIDLPKGSDGFTPQLLHADYDPNTGICVGVAKWGKEYIFNPAQKKWAKGENLDDLGIGTVSIVYTNNTPFLLLSGKGLKEKGYENTKLYLYDLQTRALQFLACGLGCEVSPDRTKVAYYRCDGHGFNQLNLLDLTTGKITTLFTYAETDPGDGITIFHRWSNDSKVVFFSGRMSSFKRSFYNSAEPVNLFYIVAEDRFLRYDGPPAKFK